VSLHLRLALWHGALTGLVVLLVALLAYALQARARYDDLDRALVGVVEHVASTPVATHHELAAMIEAPILPNVVVRGYDAKGRVVMASRNQAAAPPLDPRAILQHPPGPAYDPVVGLTPPFTLVDARGGAFGLALAPDGSRWRAYVLPFEGPAQYLVAAAPLGEIDASVGALRRLVPVLVLVGASIACVVGGLLAGRALEPLATLTETAASIARSRALDRRVPVADRRDELGRLAVTFNEMLGSIEQAYRAEQRFVADASHELRAPLTAIQANLELLERQPDMPPAERREAIAEACREARRLTQLVADLLALARADAGLPLRRWPVELDRVLLDALAEASRLARGQRLEIGRLEPAQLSGDPDRLKQLVLILLDNAIKYTPEGGQVTLELRRNGMSAEILVRDTGIGIAAEDLPHVFERFYRADPARGRDPGGTGLGLPIARSIAEQHGGQITLSSRPGEGTTARVRLPLAS